MLGKNSEQRLPCGRPRSTPTPPSAEQMEKWQQTLRNYLSSAKLKYTAQRWQIARAILLTGGHMDAQGLCARVCTQRGGGIGPATVYRTLKLLVEAGILAKSFEDASGRSIYELSDDLHHDHIICLDCNEIFEFHSDEIEGAQNSVCQKMRFRTERHRHVIYARCGFK